MQATAPTSTTCICINNGTIAWLQPTSPPHIEKRTGKQVHQAQYEPTHRLFCVCCYRALGVPRSRRGGIADCPRCQIAPGCPPTRSPRHGQFVAETTSRFLQSRIISAETKHVTSIMHTKHVWRSLPTVHTAHKVSHPCYEALRYRLL